MNAIGQRIHRDWRNGRFFHVWVLQSAGIGDFVQLAAALRAALNSIGGAEFCLSIMRRHARYVVNEFVAPLALRDFMPAHAVHRVRAFSECPIDPVLPAAGDYLLDFTDRGFAQITKLFPANRVFSPYKDYRPENWQLWSSKYRWWVPLFTARDRDAQIMAMDDTPRHYHRSKMRRCEASSGKVVVFPFARDGGYDNVKDDECSTGRSLSPLMACSLAKHGSVFHGEPYHWITPLSKEIEARGATDLIWKNRVPVEGMVDAIASAAGVITVDTASAHIAAAFNKPTVILVDDRNPVVLSRNLQTIPHGLCVPIPCNVRETMAAEANLTSLLAWSLLSRMGVEL